MAALSGIINVSLQRNVVLLIGFWSNYNGNIFIFLIIYTLDKQYIHSHNLYKTKAFSYRLDNFMLF